MQRQLFPPESSSTSHPASQGGLYQHLSTLQDLWNDYPGIWKEEATHSIRRETGSNWDGRPNPAGPLQTPSNNLTDSASFNEEFEVSQTSLGYGMEVESSRERQLLAQKRRLRAATLSSPALAPYGRTSSGL